MTSTPAVSQQVQAIRGVLLRYAQEEEAGRVSWGRGGRGSSFQIIFTVTPKKIQKDRTVIYVYIMIKYDIYLYNS